MSSARGLARVLALRAVHVQASLHAEHEVGLVGGRVRGHGAELEAREERDQHGLDLRKRQSLPHAHAWPGLEHRVRKAAGLGAPDPSLWVEVLRVFPQPLAVAHEPWREVHLNPRRHKRPVRERVVLRCHFHLEWDGRIHAHRLVDDGVERPDLRLHLFAHVRVPLEQVGGPGERCGRGIAPGSDEANHNVAQQLAVSELGVLVAEFEKLREDVVLGCQLLLALCHPFVEDLVRDAIDLAHAFSQLLLRLHEPTKNLEPGPDQAQQPEAVRPIESIAETSFSIREVTSHADVKDAAERETLEQLLHVNCLSFASRRLQLVDHFL
eukprot:3939211-Rhodomonas_salina.3